MVSSVAFSAGSSSTNLVAALIALIAIIVGATIGAALCWLVAHLAYGYCVKGWKCPDLGALGGTLYFDERRGQCFCAVFCVTVFSFMSCVAAYLASQSDPEMIAIFGFARLQSTDPLTYLVIGLKGYVVCADIPEDDLALDDGAEATKSYVPYVSGESDKMEELGGSSYDWINACAASGDIAAASIIPIIAVKFVACFVLYKRVDTEADSWVWKFLGLGVELLSAVMRV